MPSIGHARPSVSCTGHPPHDAKINCLREESEGLGAVVAGPLPSSYGNAHIVRCVTPPYVQVESENEVPSSTSNEHELEDQLTSHQEFREGTTRCHL